MKKSWPFPDLILNVGLLLVLLTSISPVSLSLTSRWNLCSTPPSNPGWHVTVSADRVWLCTSHPEGGSGGPAKDR